MRKSQIIEIKNFKGGSNRVLSDARIAIDESPDNLNLIQVEDFLWKSRWGTQFYGADIGAVLDGSAEYIKSDSTREVIAVAGGVAYKATNGGAWTSISGATFTAGIQCYFKQIAGYLYIVNGTDKMARYNGTVLSTYAELSTPTGLSASLVSGLTTGSFVVWGQVTALNSIGETVGSTEVSISVNTVRDNWLKASNQGVVWSWGSVSGASRYQLYISDQAGYEALLTDSTTTSYTDYGETQINPYVQTPLSNTTSAPKFKSITVSGNRMWATNDPNNPYTVYFSGTGPNMGIFSDFYGGGWINLEKGGRETPQVVVHYQSGTGEGRATILSKTPEGQGAVWQINIDSLTVGATLFAVPSALKINGGFGTEAVLGTVTTPRSIMFPNKRGWFALGPEKQYYGLLITNELSSKIRNYWRSLNQSAIDKIACYYYDSKIFISVPTSSAGNSKTIIYDLERANWNVEWSIGAKQFFEYTDNNGTSHFLYFPVGGSQLIEISENFQGDLGQPIETRYTSGRIQLGKFWKDFVKVDKTYVKLGNPRGAINWEVSGTQKNKAFTALVSKTISSQSANTGMGWDLMGEFLMGETSGVPSTFSDSSDPHYVKVRKKMRDIQFRITSNSYDSSYTLQGFLVEGNPMATRAPNSWKVSS